MLTPTAPAGERQRGATHAEGYAAGVKAQRERWQAVFTDPAAAGCSDLALTLCRDTDMPAGAIVAALAVAGRGAASKGPRLNRASLRADRQAAALASSWDRAMQGAALVATRGKPD